MNEANLIKFPKRIIWLLCLSLFFILVYSCKPGKANKETRTSKVTILGFGDERIFFQDYWDVATSFLMFLPMLTNTGDDFLAIEGVLAERWEHSDDYKKWIFYLRKGITWHDDVPVTAHDIKFTFDLRADGRKQRGINDPLITVVDDYTLTMLYEVPTEGESRNTWTVYYPKHLLKDLDPKDFFKWDFWKHPVGNGPYKFVRNVPQTMVELKANPDYFKGKPKIEQVVLKFSKNPSLLELLSGDVDAIDYASSDMLLKISNDDRFNIYYSFFGDKDQFDVIYWNHNYPLFKESQVRKALTMAIDRRGLIKLLNYPTDMPVPDVIPSPRQFNQKKYPEPVSYDPEEAIKIMSDLGWNDSNEDGIIEKNGKDFGFTLLLSSENESIGVYIQDQLKKIGVAVALKPMEGNVFTKKFRAGDFDALIRKMTNNINNQNFGMLAHFGAGNVIGYKNKDMEDLLKLADNTFEKDKEDEYFDQINSIFQKDYPVSVLLHNISFSIANKRIRGLKNISRPYPVWFMEYLWLEDN